MITWQWIILENFIKINFIASISGKLSRNTFVNYETPKYFIDRHAMPNLAGINYEEQQKLPCEIDARGYIQQVGY